VLLLTVNKQINAKIEHKALEIYGWHMIQQLKTFPVPLPGIFSNRLCKFHLNTLNERPSPLKSGSISISRFAECFHFTKALFSNLEYVRFDTHFYVVCQVWKKLTQRTREREKKEKKKLKWFFRVNKVVEKLLNVENFYIGIGFMYDAFSSTHYIQGVLELIFTLPRVLSALHRAKNFNIAQNSLVSFSTSWR
jgi:hypothetical protein